MMIPVRRAMAKRAWRVRLRQLGVAGAVVGFPHRPGLVDRPAERADVHRLRARGGRLPRNRSGQRLLLYTAKLATFGHGGVLTTDVIAGGAGDWYGADDRPIPGPPYRAQRPQPQTYARLIDLVLVAAATGMFIAVGSV